MMARRLIASFRGRAGFFVLCVMYASLVAVCLGTLTQERELSLGRNPLANIIKTASEFARPSFLDAWFGDTRLEYKSDDGTVLRVENRQVVERGYLSGLASATWDTIRIATLGSLLGALLGLPLAWLTAQNMAMPKPVAWGAKALLDITRSIHTLVFGLVLVGIVGLGPTAGILAIGLHSMGTYGKLFAESIESLDMGAIEGVRNVGATPLQVFFNAVWPSVLPQFVSSHLYIWEFNIRDSTILGVIGAGGLGMLISEAASLFQWGRLSTVLIVIVALVFSFDAMSRRIRQLLI
ncbi:phosphonate ABC transporter, permease protein PhnE [Glaciimonas immobilis]|uniref:Phosphonate ABC transporter permease subunit PhnE n=1 Tax=Glaciimonas immobilis TaxID=728004 RepID=A0A840RX27_9BURK|nr:phosphonate ABC transporter, permease protein PhnE [Glaciimonas immobilis]KAF3996533.1 phosphonate ABC transporter, permease protein PhnE [Glaciimonas immobilis]MBB5201101.1 phosphonate ABC transporter permease subunit PhnE [Glaciimonas immobilis]